MRGSETRSPIGPPVGLMSGVKRDPSPRGHPARQSERGATVRGAATGWERAITREQTDERDGLCSSRDRLTCCLDVLLLRSCGTVDLGACCWGAGRPGHPDRDALEEGESTQGDRPPARS